MRNIVWGSPAAIVFTALLFGLASVPAATAAPADATAVRAAATSASIIHKVPCAMRRYCNRRGCWTRRVCW